MDEHEITPRDPTWRRYLRFFHVDHVADLDDELRDHVESAIEALVARGMTPEAARDEALRRFGDVSKVRAEVRRLDARHQRRASRIGMLETLLYDLRHAVRGLRRSPAFAITASLSIALGVAANATVFSAVNALLFRPIPGTHADRLMRVYVNHHSPFDWRDLSWMRDRVSAFQYVVGERYGSMGLRAPGGTETERVHTSYVTRGFFPALGVRMAVGRAFDVDENGGASDPVAVLSYAFWQRRFAGDSSIIGKRVSIGDHPLTVVGVVGSEFRSSVMTWVPDVIIPFAAAPLLTGRPLSSYGGSFYATARLRAGVSPEEATSELGVALRQLAQTDTARYAGVGWRLDHIRGVNAELRAGVAAGSAFLMGMVGLVLLIACANVANLLLGRAAARRTEMGVRLAIGASRGRIVRQLLTESVLVATLGGTLGMATAWSVTRTLAALLPAEAGLDRAFFAPDARVVLFTGLICLASALLFGTGPALRAASPSLVTMLRGRDASGRTRRRGVLIGVQSALCVLLLAVASLFLRSLASMRAVDPGFVAEGVIDVDIDLGLLGKRGNDAEAFARIVDGAKTLPGVESTTLTAVVPLTGSNMETRIAPEGTTLANRRDYPAVYFQVVGRTYFATLRIPLVRGREFLESDTEASSPVAVVSETVARRLWPRGDALGRRLTFAGSTTPSFQVVGIVKDAAYLMPGEDPKPLVYFAFAQQPRAEMTLLLRTNADVATTRTAIWDMLRLITPTLPPPPVVRMRDDMAITLLPVQLGASLLGVFGALALLLASTGIYGVAAYSVARRTREIGIRAALGATQTRLVGMVLLESASRVMSGAVVGVLLTIGVAAVLSRLLYGVHALDVAVLVAVVSMIAAVAIMASLAPAFRAARADPVRSIRVE